jgi:hypothetical protein
MSGFRLLTRSGVRMCAAHSGDRRDLLCTLPVGHDPCWHEARIGGRAVHRWAGTRS